MLLPRINAPNGKKNNSGGGSGRRRRRRLPPPRQEKQQNGSGMFRSFSIATDPASRKYMPYDRLVYPRVHGRPPAGELGENSNLSVDSMWMLGLVEETENTSRQRLLKELQAYISLPGTSTVLPGSLEVLNKLRKKKEEEEGSELLKKREAAPSNGRGLTQEEHMKLKMLERRLKVESLGGEGVFQKKVMFAPYRNANKKLRKVLERGAGGASLMLPTFANGRVDLFLKHSLREVGAAIKLQRFWRRYYIREKFFRMMRRMFLIRKIQAVARGYVTRRLLERWKRQREGMVLGWQTLFRRALSNIHWRGAREREGVAATRIQAWRRGLLGFREADLRKRERSALKIQKLWRGCASRARTDREWLDKQAAILQKYARRLVARRVFEVRRRVVTAAAVAIQRGARGFAARLASSRQLWDRETTRRSEALRVLAAEEQWYAERLQTLEKRHSLPSPRSAAAREEREKEAHDLVSTRVEAAHFLGEQSKLLSPRAKQQGWRQDLEENFARTRREITEAKLSAVFEAAADARNIEEELASRKKQMDYFERKKDEIAGWRESAQRSFLERDARKQSIKAAREWRQKVADEKRHWAVSFFTASGKPDKLKTRRRLFPEEFESDPVENAAHRVFSGGAVDLLAGEEGGGAAAETRSGLDKVVAQVELQNHLIQIQVFDKLFKPAERIMEGKLQQPPLLPPPELPELLLQQPADHDAGGGGGDGFEVESGPQEQLLAVSNEQEEGVVEEGDGNTVITGATNKQHFKGFVGYYGAAASVPRGKPLDPGTTPYKMLHLGRAESPRERAQRRRRQRSLYTLEREDQEEARAAPAAGPGQAAPYKSRIPWVLLDELDAEKHKFMLAKAADPISHSKNF